MNGLPNLALTSILSFLVGLLLLSIKISSAQSIPDTAIGSETCGPQTYAPTDPYANSVAYVLTDLISVTPSKNRYDYYTSSPYPEQVAYGHATCNQTLANAYCADCLVSAKINLAFLCAPCTSGQVTMIDCSMSYQSYAYSH